MRVPQDNVFRHSTENLIDYRQLSEFNIAILAEREILIVNHGLKMMMKKIELKNIITNLDRLNLVAQFDMHNMPLIIVKGGTSGHF